MPRRHAQLKSVFPHPMTTKEGYKAWESQTGLTSRWAGSVPKRSKKKGHSNSIRSAARRGFSR